MYVESLDSTQATTATQLWIPKPMSLDHDPKVSKQKVNRPRSPPRMGYLAVALA